MFKNISCVLIWSEDYKRLSNWYKDVLGLEAVDEITHPEDTGVEFKVGESCLWIGQHDKVHGENKDPHRHMFNLTVDSVSETFEHLQSKGVEFIASPFKAPTFDKYFATFYDADKNIVQLIGGK